VARPNLALLRGCEIQVAKKLITSCRKVRAPLGLLQIFTIPAVLANMAPAIPEKVTSAAAKGGPCDARETRSDQQRSGGCRKGNRHAVFQKDLFVLQRILTEVGRLDVASVRRGVEAEQARLDDVRKRADTAQAALTQLQQDITSKQRELASVEATIQQRTVELNQLNEGYLNLRNLLAAA
jgi:hypothetical protein